MSLLRLLAAGKSLVGLKNSESRYHLPGNKPLPRFGSKKNPFRATVFPDKAEAPSTVPDPAQIEPVPPGSGGEERVDGVSDKQIPASGSAPAPLHPHATAGPTLQAKSLHLSTPATSAFRAFLLWSRVKKVKPNGCSTSVPMVQAELSLDAVKVVRNDLSESDLEVVQPRQGCASNNPEGSHVGAAAPKLPGSRPSWVAPAGRLFGIGKM
jgi:hypothetical protein